MNFKTTLQFCLCLFLVSLSTTFGESAEQIVLDITPTKEFPRNSEGAFVTLKSKRVLFVYSQFQGSAADESPVRIVSVFSDDGGRTWSQQPEVVAQNGGGQNLMSVSLLRLADERIALFYLVKNNFHDCRPVICFSADEAKTWSKPTPVFAAPGYFVLNNDRVIQTRSGRLIMPVAFHRSRNGNPNDPHTLDYRAIDLWYLSDDSGKMWREANDWRAIPLPSKTGLHEPGVVELGNGNIFSWARTDQGCQFGCISTNRGISWSIPEPTALKSPIAPASIKRLPNSTDLLAVFNDHSGDFPFEKNKRTPLVTAISSDNGRTWAKKKLIENDPQGAFCYTAIHFIGDSVLLGYCAGDPGVNGLNRLRVRRIALPWLRE